jgi:cytochrome d ubiquinol oxidase subunit II
MFEAMSLSGLQHYWWALISVLAAALVFLLFVQGGQTLLYTIAKNETERKLLVNTLGRKWELTFTTLVTFGGAFFASFPLFYSTSFGGAYWVWIAILFCFIIQAIAYEFRTKPDNFLGKKTFEMFLIINGALGTILLGTAVGTFFNGAEFSVSKMALTEFANPVISQWKGPARGLEAVMNWHNVALGLTIFFLARIAGLQYFMNSVDDENVILRSRKALLKNAIPFLIFFLAFAIGLLLKKGFALDANGNVFMEDYKYLHNFLQMPMVLLLFLIGVVLVLTGIILPVWKPFKFSDSAFWFGSAGTFLTVFSLFLLAGYNNTAYYPSTYDLQSSLTIGNSSSSHYTLTAMSYVSLFIPFVIAYSWSAWRMINKKKIDASEVADDKHSY